MNLITKSDILKELPKRYSHQYPKNREFWDGKSSGQILELLRIEKPLTEARAIEILGHSSWTSLKCDECNREVQAVVQLGQEPDYESATACICVDCLNEAVKLTLEIT